MADKTIPISQVPADIDTMGVMAVFNPTEEDFVTVFAGRRTKPAKAGTFSNYPAPVARHIAKHLASKLVREKLTAWAKENFPGLNDEKKEAWRNQETQYVTMGDRNAVARMLLVNEEGVSEKIAFAGDDMRRGIEEAGDGIELEAGKSGPVKDLKKEIAKKKGKDEDAVEDEEAAPTNGEETETEPEDKPGAGKTKKSRADA